MIKNCFIKFIIVFVIISAFYKPAISQAYIPIPLDSTIWKVKCWAGLPWPYGWDCNIYEHTAGDTLINGKHYTLIKTLFDSFCATHVDPKIRFAAIRQDSIERKVYIIRLPDSLTERILYDFTQSTGDTCNSILTKTPSGCEPIIIQSVDSINLNSRFHKRINLYGGCCMASLIEGIGSTYGLVDPLFVFESGSDLECVRDYKNGIISIISNFSGSCDTANIGVAENKSINEIFTIFPNPFFTNTTIQTSFLMKHAELTVYNSFGQAVKQVNNISGQSVILSRDNLSVGIYFVRLTEDNKTIAVDKLVIVEF